MSAIKSSTVMVTHWSPGCPLPCLLCTIRPAPASSLPIAVCASLIHVPRLIRDVFFASITMRCPICLRPAISPRSLFPPNVRRSIRSSTCSFRYFAISVSNFVPACRADRLLLVNLSSVFHVWLPGAIQVVRTHPATSSQIDGAGCAATNEAIRASHLVLSSSRIVFSSCAPGIATW